MTENQEDKRDLVIVTRKKKFYSIALKSNKISSKKSTQKRNFIFDSTKTQMHV